MDAANELTGKQGKNFPIRVARPSDAETLTRLAFDAKRHWGYADSQMETWRPDLRITAAMLANHPASLIEHEGRVAGFYLIEQNGATASLEHLWVHPECIGRGFGRALLDHACAKALALGAGMLHIDADPNAEAFYRHCGAIRVAAVPAPIDGDTERIRPQLTLDLTTLHSARH